MNTSKLRPDPPTVSGLWRARDVLCRGKKTGRSTFPQTSYKNCKPANTGKEENSKTASYHPNGNKKPLLPVKWKKGEKKQSVRSQETSDCRYRSAKPNSDVPCIKRKNHRVKLKTDKKVKRKEKKSHNYLESCRIGEASNPGPEPSDEYQCKQVTECKTLRTECSIQYHFHPPKGKSGAEKRIGEKGGDKGKGKKPTRWKACRHLMCDCTKDRRHAHCTGKSSNGQRVVCKCIEHFAHLNHRETKEVQVKDEYDDDYSCFQTEPVVQLNAKAAEFIPQIARVDTLKAKSLPVKTEIEVSSVSTHVKPVVTLSTPARNTYFPGTNIDMKYDNSTA